MPAQATAQATDPVIDPVIDCRDLVVRYGDRVAVDNLTLRAEGGRVLALLGPNGAGKTSTVETFEGYRRPTSGSVRVLGLDPAADHRRLMPRIGVMLQRGGIYPTATPRQVLSLFSRYYEQPEDPGALLDLVGLAAAARTPWRRLSGGEQQRLSLALALVGRPDVAFLDEPTAGVDPEGRMAIRAAVRALRDRGVCVLLTTHELAEAEHLADDIRIIDRGRLVAAGTLEELSASGGGPSVRFRAPSGLDRPALAGALGVPPSAISEPSPGEYRVAVEASAARVAAVADWLARNGVAISDLRAGAASLEEAYLALTGGGEDR